MHLRRPPTLRRAPRGREASRGVERDPNRRRDGPPLNGDAGYFHISRTQEGRLPACRGGTSPKCLPAPLPLDPCKTRVKMETE